MKIKEHLKLLGLRVKDKVTGFKGVVSSALTCTAAFRRSSIPAWAKTESRAIQRGST